MIRPRWSRPQPEVPIQRGRNGGCVLRPIDSLRPVFIEQSVRRPVRPYMSLAHGANRSVPDHFAEPARGFGRLALISHLRGHLVLPRRRGDLARLPDGMSPRLLAIDVLAHF